MIYPMSYNRTFIDNDTTDQVNKYIDEICSDPVFLCKNRELCGKNTTIYSSVENVNTICTDMKKANECDNDFQECVVQVSNTLEGSQKFISTSFVNVIVPIPNALDRNGNNKFIRLPGLSGSKKPKSMETCSICACMNRFATSPGGGTNEYTSPGQNECVFIDFEYYYYPVAIENLNRKIKDTPPIILGKYLIINSNIIPVLTEEDLSPINLYKLLIKNGIPDGITLNFITKVLYKGNDNIVKELQLYLINDKGLFNKK
jgi:hypothetical protein